VIDDALLYLLADNDMRTIGFTFILCMTLIFSLIYYWRAWK